MTDTVDHSSRDDSLRSPVNAFSLLANEARIAVMRVLWEASEPLAFSEIADRAAIRDTGNLNYHLGKLVGHFVTRTDDEQYQLSRAGRNAMTAVLAGNLTDEPTLRRARIEHPCPYCGEPMEINYGSDETLRLLCSTCPGSYRGKNRSPYEPRDNPERTITVLDLPPNGITRESPTEIAEVAVKWSISRVWISLSGTCPDCAGETIRTVHACPDHDPEGGICQACDARFAVLFEQRCTECHTGHEGAAFVELLRGRRVREWFLQQGFDLAEFHLEDWLQPFPDREIVHSTDPLDYEVRWVVDANPLTVRSDETLSATNVERR